MKVVVTGASGNLGSHIVGSTGSDFEFLPIGRNDWGLLEQVPEGTYQALIHCAYDLKTDLNKFPSKNLESNILATSRALEITNSKKIGTFVFISSCAVYGDLSNSTEDRVNCNPVTMNGHIKLFNEELVKSYCKVHGINSIILRVFNTYGGKDSFSVINRMINCSKNNSDFILVNDGMSERDFVHVEDVAQVTLKLLKKDIKNEVLNIGSGKSFKIIDILRAVEKKHGKINLVKKTNPNESAFSRANLTKLNTLIQHDCRDLLDYLSESL